MPEARLKSGRKAADHAGAGREEIWAAIRAHDGAFTVPHLIAASGANDKTIRDYCKGLTAAGYLQQLPEPAGIPAKWTLERDVGVEAPRVRPDGTPVTQGATTEQLWRGMTILKEFTYLDLVESASIVIPPMTAKAYCAMLLATGYLRVLRKAQPRNGRVARYRLVRNNGPKPPQIQRVKRVYDPNSREVFMPEGQP